MGLVWSSSKYFFLVSYQIEIRQFSTLETLMLSLLKIKQTVGLLEPRRFLCIWLYFMRIALVERCIWILKLAGASV
jgi:hypothetical protein